MNSQELIDEIRRQKADTEFSKMLRELLFELKGPFIRDSHQHYDISQPDIITAINLLGYEHKVAVKFRELRDNAEGIFEQRGTDVDVGIYSADEILDGNAAVCEKSKYRGKDLLLLNPNDPSKSISVFARNSFRCIKPSVGGISKPLVQINPNDAKKLFGNIKFEEKHIAILYPAPSGYSIGTKLVGVFE